MDKNTYAIMILAEKSLKDFLEDEPDIYSLKDIKANPKKPSFNPTRLFRKNRIPIS
jgi:hypothetical protein